MSLLNQVEPHLVPATYIAHSIVRLPAKIPIDSNIDNLPLPIPIPAPASNSNARAGIPLSYRRVQVDSRDIINPILFYRPASAPNPNQKYATAASGFLNRRNRRPPRLIALRHVSHRDPLDNTLAKAWLGFRFAIRRRTETEPCIYLIILRTHRCPPAPASAPPPPPQSPPARSS
ncbi:hypothetical protein B0H17DRAFT_1192401 [Mycena rosella]|uniref:Uncharacterized protein n=1 Tax=Mycena rosella TaxID=1033263 RepID=A0AAD7GWJ1_MYCRO|nr:hypothetical protein B0H17DRAFT_1192401 [Mycena rosella]